MVTSEAIFNRRKPRCVSKPNVKNIAAAVMTRAQTTKVKFPINPLKVPEVKSDEINVDQLKKSQMEDKSLDKL